MSGAKLAVMLSKWGLAVGGMVRQGRVGPADEGGQVATVRPRQRTDRIGRHVLHSQIACFAVDEEGGGGVERAQQGRLPDAVGAEDQAFDAAAFGCALVSGDDLEGHQSRPSVVRGWCSSSHALSSAGDLVALAFVPLARLKRAMNHAKAIAA